MSSISLSSGWKRLRHQPEFRIWLLATALVLLNAISQRLVSTTADVDQAGELFRSQWWALGYSSQPPLYTWISRSLMLLTGPSLWTLAAIKVALLSTLMGTSLTIGRLMAFSISQQWIAVAGFALIPQFAWESQRDLTHSVLAATLALLTLLQLLVLERCGSWRNYAMAGVIAAAGVLSKYNFLVFLAGLIAAALCDQHYRRVLLHPRSLLAVAVMGLLVSPHLSWALQHPQLALGGLDKLDSETDQLGARLKGVASGIKSAVAFLTPLWLSATVLSWNRLQNTHQMSQKLLRRLPAALAATLLVVILVTGATRIKDRWYQSLLVYAPLVVASLAGPTPARGARKLFSLSAAASIAVSAAALPGRTLLAGVTGKSSRPNLPLQDLLKEIRDANPHPDLIVAGDGLLAGNARLAFPHTRIWRADTPNPPLPLGAQPTTVLVIREPTQSGQSAADSAINALLTSLKPNRMPPRFYSVQKPMLWNPAKSFSLEWGITTLPANRTTHA